MSVHDPYARPFRSNALLLISVVALIIGTIALNLVGSTPSWHTTTLWSYSASSSHGENKPIAATMASNGHIFVAHLGGVIGEYDSAADTSQTTVTDLSTEVYNPPVGFAGGIHGLLGLTVDPQFASGRPYLYAMYTRDSKTKGGSTSGGAAWGDACPNHSDTEGCIVWSRVVRITVNVSTSVASATTTLLDDWCSQFTHLGGAITIGPDGKLYVAGGDGGNYGAPDARGNSAYRPDYGEFHAPTGATDCGDPNMVSGETDTWLHAHPGVYDPPANAEGGSLRAQQTRVLQNPGLDGTMVRIDPDTGAAVAGNPFKDIPTAGADKQRIIAYGLRNPFRFNFLPGSNQLWISAAGWNSFEMIQDIPDATDRIVDNFGWPCMEGNVRQATWDAMNVNLCESLYATVGTNWRRPDLAYKYLTKVTANDTCTTYRSALAGIAFYEGSSYPAQFQNGGMFFTDYERDCIWAAPPQSNGQPDFTKLTMVLNLDPGDTGHTTTKGPVDIEQGPSGNFLIPEFDADRIVELVYS